MATAYIDLDQLAEEAKSFEPPADGEYRVKCVDAAAKKTSTGKMMLRCEYVIVDAGPEKGKKVWNQYVDPTTSNEFAKGFFSRNLKAHGVSGGKREWGEIAAKMVGANVILTVKRGEYKGRATADVTNVQRDVSTLPSAPTKQSSEAPTKPSFM